MIKVILIISMTKEEVERDIIPGLKTPPQGYFYWWENRLMVKFPIGNGEIAEVPCVLNKDDMLIEVVDKKDIYKQKGGDTCE